MNDQSRNKITKTNNENKDKKKNAIMHIIAASVSFFGKITDISNLNVVEIANNWTIAIKIAKTPKSVGEKNLVNIGNSNITKFFNLLQ